MDYFIENAKEIMFLCFGGGFVILATYVTVTLRRVASLLKKVDALTEIFTGYVYKPLQLLKSFEKNANKWMDKMK